MALELWWDYFNIEKKKNSTQIEYTTPSNNFFGKTISKRDENILVLKYIIKS